MCVPVCEEAQLILCIHSVLDKLLSKNLLEIFNKFHTFSPSDLQDVRRDHWNLNSHVI